MTKQGLTFHYCSLFSIVALAAALLSLYAIPASAQEGTNFEGQIAYLGEDSNIWILRGTGEQIQVTTDGGSGDFHYQSPAFSTGKLYSYTSRRWVHL